MVSDRPAPNWLVRMSAARASSGVGLTWREVVILRAYAKYLRQAGIAFSQAYMEQTLAANAKITRRIGRLMQALVDIDPEILKAA